MSSQGSRRLWETVLSVESWGSPGTLRPTHLTNGIWLTFENKITPRPQEALVSASLQQICISSEKQNSDPLPAPLEVANPAI